MSGTRHTTHIWPTLRYNDANAAIAFLCAAYGFEQVAVYHREGDAEIVEHAELRWPLGGGVMLGSVREDSSISQLPPGLGSIYVVCREPDALHERAIAAGASISPGLTDEDYGSRGFTSRDPEGVHWSFGTYAGAQAR